MFRAQALCHSDSWMIAELPEVLLEVLSVVRQATHVVLGVAGKAEDRADDFDSRIDADRRGRVSATGSGGQGARRQTCQECCSATRSDTQT